MSQRLLRRLSAAVTATALLAGCGSGGHPKASSSPNAQDVAAAYRRLAQCVRAHGLPNFPDPVRDPQTGQWGLPAGTPDPPENVMDDCRSTADRIPADRTGTTLSARDMAKLREFAECFRRHGVPDWPDPAPDGSFTMPARLAGQGKQPIMKQLEACKRYGVGGGLKIRRPGDPSHG
ncbi:hypothetical protein AB0L00_21670 [Actinoallomurus sp. NPDC052308]|uniref:hypothetical protein n=1 Tax=Actinoallomurus sp. NPDC052308 TaxID=3155530 RepID=UPI003448F323